MVEISGHIVFFKMGNFANLNKNRSFHNMRAINNRLSKMRWQ